MTVRTHTFPLTETPRAIEVRNPAGSVTVRAVEGADELAVRVEALDGADHTADRVDVDASPSRLRVSVPERRLVRTPALAIEVTTPPGAAVRVAVGSADVELRGRLGHTEVTGASGDVSVEHCTELELRSASGDVQAGAVEGVATVATASGNVRMDSAGGAVLVRTASGDVTVGEAGDDVSVTSASGDINIGRACRGTVQLKTVSADARVSVKPGLRVWLDVRSISGRLYSGLDDEGPDAGGSREAELAVVLQSVSGDLRVRRAAPRAASD
ncbi:Putative adhesin [Modestobacter sp. DSM 44400]|uniref:DUF4097 family beta strand repeat-containing protein n=1 Tax=Modestobacter sp. DSM 44400 TaxID=1550230 RepID=UPI00089636E2|nr:DUF4097 family beta strand repeat-containing protein [Modestobacter sp. DSM 44400]SDY72871.1 Putative adhesin [Modestobacter sp. DSM 44400]